MNKQKTCIIVDSSASIKNSEIDNVFMIPLSIVETINDKEVIYKDLEEINTKDVVLKILDNKDLKTSQSSLGEMMQILDELIDKYQRIFVVSISSGLSGSFNTWNIAKEEYSDKEIVVLDARDLGYGNQIVVNNIIQMVKENKSTKEIINYVEERKKKRYAALIVTDISQLKKGGRINAAKAWIVDKLKLNIIITFDGALDFYDKSKSIDKAIDLSLEKINKETNYIANGIKHACVYTTYIDEEKNKELQSIISSKINYDIKVMDMPSAIAVHTGAKTFAIYIEAN